MKALIAVVAVAAMGAVAAAITIGGRVAEPTVVADPYEAGLHYDDAHRHAADVAAVGPRAPPRCDLGRTPCARAVGGATVTLDVSRPLRTMADLVFTVSVAPASAAGAGPGRIALEMPGMYMGENRVALAASGEGRWQGRGVIVRCPSGKRAWTAEVTLPASTSGGEPLRATFPFEVAP